MRILVACELPDFALEELRALSTEVIYRPQVTAEQLPAQLTGVTVLIVNRTAVPATAIAAGGSLQMIVRAGTDVEHIAVEAASNEGIFVCNAPNRTSVAVAEMFFAFALALDRGLPGVSGPRAEAGRVEARGLAGRTLGCIGFGPASREICRRATAFGMDVLVWSPAATVEEIAAGGYGTCSWPSEVAERCDVIANCDRMDTGGEQHLGPDFVSNLRAGAIVVHIGDLAEIDEAGLAEAVQERGVRVAIDLPLEPTRDGQRGRGRLLELPGVLVTHRTAAKTAQARQSIAAEAVRVVRQFLVAGTVENCVNLLERSPATWLLVLRLKDAVGVLAGIMETIRSDGVNAEEITTRVFTGARAAWCTIALDERPSAEAVSAIRNVPGVLHLELRAVV